MNELEKLELQEIEGVEYLDGFRVDSLEKLSWCMRKIAAYQSKVDDVNYLVEYEKKRIDDWAKSELSKYEQSIEFFKQKSIEYHANVLAIDPKQKSISTPYGKVKSRISKQQPEKIDEVLLAEFLHQNNKEYVKEEVKLKVDWASYKKTLNIVEGNNGLLVIDENGNIVEGVTVKPESISYSVEV